MTTPFIVLSHNNGDGARELAAALGCRLASHSSTAPLPRNKVMINLGCNNDHPLYRRYEQAPNSIKLINSFQRVAVVQSKLRTLRILGDDSRFSQHFRNSFGPVCVPFLQDPAEVALAVRERNETWVARTLDRGSSGAGIELVTNDVLNTGRIPRAAVYTKAIDKRREYRVHVGTNRDGTPIVLDVVRKIRRPDVDDTNRPFIWNHDSDFIFVRNGVNTNTVPQKVIAKAKAAVHALNLSFGAVDVIVERGGRLPDAQAYVLEVNTAPGMEGQTVTVYAEYFRYCAKLIDTAPTWRGDFTEEQGDQS